MQKSFFTPLFFVLFTLFNSCSQQGKESKNLIIAVSSNMHFAIEELVKEFTDKYNVKCELVIGSSGKLTAQIKEGAPYHIFVSANAKYPNDLYKKNLASDKPKTFARGKLVLWSMVDNLTPTMDILKEEKIQHIALANPTTAPYGLAAMEILNHYNLLIQVENKLVYGESISQTNQFITTKSADIGFTSLSVVLSPKIKGKGKWKELNPKLYSPIEQTAMVVGKPEQQHPKAKLFYNFLFSPEAKKILKDFGYLVNE